MSFTNVTSFNDACLGTIYEIFNVIVRWFRFNLCSVTTFFIIKNEVWFRIIDRFCFDPGFNVFRSEL